MTRSEGRSDSKPDSIRAGSDVERLSASAVIISNMSVQSRENLQARKVNAVGFPEDELDCWDLCERHEKMRR